MKKLLSLILALTILSSCLALVGCNLWDGIFGMETTTQSSNPTVTTKPTTTTKPSTPTVTTKPTTTTKPSTTTKPTTTTTTTTTTGSSSDTGEIVWEDKIYCNTTIDDNYVPGEVIVVLDKAISEVNKVHSKDFFTGVDILNIEDLTHFSNPDVIVDKENFNQVLLLTLSEQTKEAVIDAIKIIEQIVGVKYVGPNGEDEPEDLYPDDPY